MDCQNLSTDPDAGEHDNGGRDTSSQRPLRRSKRIQEAEEQTNPGDNDSPDSRLPPKPLATRVVKKPKTRVAKNPSTPGGRMNKKNKGRNRTDEDPTLATRDIKEATKHSSPVGVGISTVMTADTPETSAASSRVATNLDNNIKTGDVSSDSLATFGMQSGTPGGTRSPFDYNISYDQDSVTENFPAIHDHRVDQEVKAKGHAELPMPPMPAATAQPLETSADPAHRIGITRSAPGNGTSVGGYVTAQRLAPPMSHTESVLRSSPHHYVALANVQGISDTLLPNYPQPKTSYMPLLPSTYLPRSTTQSSTSASSSRRKGAGGKEQATEADTEDTTTESGQRIPRQPSYANDSPTRPLASESTSVVQSWRRGNRTIIDGYRPKWTNTRVFDVQDHGSRDDIPLDRFASHLDPRDSKVGLTIASDDLAIVLFPTTDFCGSYHDRNRELFSYFGHGNCRSTLVVLALRRMHLILDSPMH